MNLLYSNAITQRILTFCMPLQRITESDNIEQMFIILGFNSDSINQWTSCLNSYTRPRYRLAIYKLFEKGIMFLSKSFCVKLNNLLVHKKCTDVIKKPTKYHKKKDKSVLK